MDTWCLYGGYPLHERVIDMLLQFLCVRDTSYPITFKKVRINSADLQHFTLKIQRVLAETEMAEQNRSDLAMLENVIAHNDDNSDDSSSSDDDYGVFHK